MLELTMMAALAIDQAPRNGPPPVGVRESVGNGRAGGRCAADDDDEEDVVVVRRVGRCRAGAKK